MASVNRFAFATDGQGYPARPNEPFRTEAEFTISLPKRGSSTVLELGCGCAPRYVHLPPTTQNETH